MERFNKNKGFKKRGGEKYVVEWNFSALINHKFMHNKHLYTHSCILCFGSLKRGGSSDVSVLSFSFACLKDQDSTYAGKYGAQNVVKS